MLTLLLLSQCVYIKISDLRMDVFSCLWCSDPAERGVVVQRPAALFGVPAVLGLACGCWTPPRVDRTPRYQLVPQLLL